MLQEAIRHVSQNACNPEAHEKLADEYLKKGRLIPAIAEYRSSIALGSKTVQTYLNLATAYIRIGRLNYAHSVCNMVLKQWNTPNIRNQFDYLARSSANMQTSDNDGYSHNIYYRLKTLSAHLLSLFGHGNFSVLDIGGGEGDLSLFLPHANYVLAEPTINGIPGLELNFRDKYFDCVVACHVLEHVPTSKRALFLDQLYRKAKSYVILLNPFYTKNGNHIEQLIYELSKADWAKEHLECTLPRIEEIEEYAAQRNISCRVIPNGSQIITAAVVFMDHFAAVSGRMQEWSKVNQLLNKYDFNEIENTNSPNAFLIELKTCEN